MTAVDRIHALFGAFMSARFIPHGQRSGPAFGHKLEGDRGGDGAPLPAFFAFTGMRTEIGTSRARRTGARCEADSSWSDRRQTRAEHSRRPADRYVSTGESAGLGVLMNSAGVELIVLTRQAIDLGHSRRCSR